MAMPRVVVFGYGPLPVENLPMSSLARRGWRIVRALLAAGHEVCFVAARAGTVYPSDLPPVLIQSKDRLSYYSIADGIAPAALDPLVPGYGGACVISIAAPAAGLADAVVGYLPHWADLAGSMPSADGTRLAYADDDAQPVDTSHEGGAFHADVFSCMDEEQRRALLAVLAARGRLNARTTGYAFVHMMPLRDDGGDPTAKDESAFTAQAAGLAELLAWASFPLHAPDWVAPAVIPGPSAAAPVPTLRRRAARKLWRLSKRAGAAVGLLSTQERLAAAVHLRRQGKWLKG